MLISEEFESSNWLCRDTGRLLLRVLTVRAVQKMLAQLQVHACIQHPLHCAP
jgi:hypothetical protein